MYEYRAMVTGVYDGDTITVDVDLGFGIWTKKQKIRLYGIDTPELRGEERYKGLISRDIVRKWILGKEITLRTIKDKKGKYGRWLGIILIESEEGILNINEMLVEKGYAEEYMI